MATDSIAETGWEQLEFHELAELFPSMSDEERSELAAGIEEFGYLHDEPITLYEGKILDGRNRFLICLELHRQGRLASPPVFTEWHPNGRSAVEWVVARNIHRRHLDASQRAALAVELLPFYEEEARQKQLTGRRPGTEPTEQSSLPLGPEESAAAPEPPPGDLGKKTSQGGRAPRARQQAAKATKANQQYVQDLKKIKAVDPQLFALVKAGKVTVQEAKSELRKREAARKSEERKAAREAARAQAQAARAKPKQPRDLPHERTCGCPDNHLNCLTADEWKRCQIGVWEFAYDGRDLRDKEVHPAMYPVRLAERCINLFTHQGQLVLDPFVGSGSTLVAAATTGRNAVGFDLNPDYIDLCLGRLAGVSRDLDSAAATQLAVCSDARKIGRRLQRGTVSLIVTSPPYSDLLNRPRANKSRRERNNEQLGKVEQYSQDERDLGTLGMVDFAKTIHAIFANLRPLLTPTGHVVLNVADTWLGGDVQRRVAMHYLVKAAMDRAGYRLRNTIIWDRNNLVNQTGIFGWPSSFITMGTTFEFLLDFVVEEGWK